MVISPVTKSSIWILGAELPPSAVMVLYTSFPLKFRSAQVTGIVGLEDGVVLFAFSDGEAGDETSGSGVAPDGWLTSMVQLKRAKATRTERDQTKFLFIVCVVYFGASVRIKFTRFQRSVSDKVVLKGGICEPGKPLVIHSKSWASVCTPGMAC